jgi:hypothetical protein
MLTLYISIFVTIVILLCCVVMLFVQGTEGLAMQIAIVLIGLQTALLIVAQRSEEHEGFAGDNEEEGEKEPKKAIKGGPLSMAFGNAISKMMNRPPPPPPLSATTTPAAPSPSSSTVEVGSNNNNNNNNNRCDNGRRDDDDHDDDILPRPALPMSTDNLKLFYSVFAKDSLERTLWHNASPKQPVDATCPKLTKLSLSLQLVIDPVVSKYTGVRLLNNTMVGPMSYLTGLDANSDFAFFFMWKPESTSVAPGTSVPIVNTYANTYTNNGFAVELVYRSKTAFEVKATYGSKLQIVSDKTEFTNETLCLLTLVKQGATLSAFVNRRDGSAAQMESTLLCNGAVDEGDISYSNKEIVINRKATLAGSVYALGLYSRALTETDRYILFAYLAWQLDAAQPAHLEKVKAKRELLVKVNEFRICPMDATTCAACSGITDWRDVFNVTQNLTDRCREAIHKFCKDNPRHPACSCYVVNSSNYTSSTCRSWRNFLLHDPNKQRIRDLEKLDEDDVRFVCSKYKDRCCPTRAKKEEEPPREERGRSRQYSSSLHKSRRRASPSSSSSSPERSKHRHPPPHPHPPPPPPPLPIKKKCDKKKPRPPSPPRPPPPPPAHHDHDASSSSSSDDEKDDDHDHKNLEDHPHHHHDKHTRIHARIKGDPATTKAVGLEVGRKLKEMMKDADEGLAHAHTHEGHSHANAHTHVGDPKKADKAARELSAMLRDEYAEFKPRKPEPAPTKPGFMDFWNRGLFKRAEKPPPPQDGGPERIG